MIKQFVAQEVCLKCQGCCRFREADSPWLPCLLAEEAQNLIDSNIPAVSISLERRIQPIPHPKSQPLGAGAGFICPLLNISDNKCKIYSHRPFECQLYPFLITLRGKKVLLTVDLNCPYIKEKIKSQELKEYTEYLTSFFNSPAQVRILKENPHIIQAYQEVLDIIELKPID